MPNGRRDDDSAAVVGFALLALLGLGAGLAYALHLRGKPGFGTLIVTVKNDATDNPVVGAEVKVENADIKTTTTDSDGTVTLSLSPGSYTLTVSCAGFTPQSDTITIEELKTTALLYRLVVGNGPPPSPGQGTLDGWVTDSQGDPIMAADVAVDGISLRTDIDGYFKQSFLDAGMYNVSVSAEGYLPQQIDVEVIKDEITTVYFTLTSEDEPPDCPDGMIWNPDTEECECPEGTEWVEPKQECLEPCTGGRTRDPETGECECPEGYRWDPFMHECVPDIPTVTPKRTTSFEPDAVEGTWVLKVPLWGYRIGYWPCYTLPRNPGRDKRLMKFLVKDIWGNPLEGYDKLGIYIDDIDQGGFVRSESDEEVFWSNSICPILLPPTDKYGMTEISYLAALRTKDDRPPTPFTLVDTRHDVVLMTGLVRTKGGCSVGFPECSICYHFTGEWSNTKFSWNWLSPWECPQPLD